MSGGYGGPLAGPRPQYRIHGKARRFHGSKFGVATVIREAPKVQSGIGTGDLAP